MTELRDAAIAYANAGYHVFPLRGKIPHPNCPECAPPRSDRPNPRYREHRAADCDHELCHGLLAATTDPERVGRWWTRWPRRNIGARVPQDLLVLDVDPREDGHDKLDAFQAAYGQLPETRTSMSGRGDGGRHLWWLHPGGKPTTRLLGRGLDLKDWGGYVLLPPSIHPDTGNPYTWVDQTADAVTMPAWLRVLICPPPPPRRTQPPARTYGDTDSIADAYTASVGWRDVLEPHGWTCTDLNADADGARWRHPTATNALSATVRDDCLFVYSQSTQFEPTAASDPHGYTRFRAYAVLNHGGDLRSAARALREGGR